MGWFQTYLNSTTELESPRSYFYWSMLTAISAVVKKKIWLDRGKLYKLYPNIYTFLISKQSGLRKGIPIYVATKLAYDIGKVRVIDGQNTIQGVIKELSQSKTVGAGHVIKDAEGFLISGEFADFMIQDLYGSVFTTLTNLYDSQYHEFGYRKRLSTQEEIELKNICLTGLYASNETHFFNSVPRHALQGGFMARTFCIYEEKRNKVNSLTGIREPIPQELDYPTLLTNLYEIEKLEGRIIPIPKVNQIYDDWYYPFCEKDHEDNTGTNERLGDNVWKAAMLLALTNEERDLIIYEKNMEEAIYQVTLTYNNVRRLLLGGTADQKNIKSITMKKTLAMLLSNPEFECERKTILRNGAGDFGVYDLDETIEHLQQAGMIEVEKRGQGVYYKLSKWMINKHMELSKEKGEAASGGNNGGT